MSTVQRGLQLHALLRQVMQAFRAGASASAAAARLFGSVRLLGPLVPQGGVVGFGDGVRLDGSEPLA
jgi:hypothetical protein